MVKLAQIVSTLTVSAIWVILFYKIGNRGICKRKVNMIISIIGCGISEVLIAQKMKGVASAFGAIILLCLVEWIYERRISLSIIVQAMASYLVVKGVSLLCIVLPFPLLMVVGKTKNEVVWICLQLALLIPIAVHTIRYVRRHDMSVFCDKYPLAIEGAFGLVFLTSYGIMGRSFERENLLLSQYILLVVLCLSFALVMWTLIDQTRHKKQLQLIKQLEALRDETHRYKEKVPAVERELRSLKRRMETMEKSEVAEELEAAIGTASAMRKQIEADSQARLLQNAEMPSTGLPVLNEQLAIEREKAAALGIMFTCEVLSGADAAAKEAGLPEHLLMQVLGDLYRNAERAVVAGTGEVRQILLTMGHTAAGYRFTMSDTGTAFPREALETIGVLCPTADGHGHGMAHICTILRQYGASLEVDTRTRQMDCYTKDISVILDGKAELRIWTEDGVETCKPLSECGREETAISLEE